VRIRDGPAAVTEHDRRNHSAGHCSCYNLLNGRWPVLGRQEREGLDRQVRESEDLPARSMQASSRGRARVVLAALKGGDQMRRSLRANNWLFYGMRFGLSGLRQRAVRQPLSIGFSLVELLVAVTLIGILLGLLLPAIQTTREVARKTQCQNHLHEIGIALLAYHNDLQAFPTGCLEWRSPANPTQRQLAWSAFLLPYLDEQALFDSLELSMPFDSLENSSAASRVIPVFVCPTGSRGTQLEAGRGPCDYGGIYGERIQSPNHPPKGSMLIDEVIRLSQITDGSSHTLIVAEDSGFADGQWINGRNIFDQAFAINTSPDFENDIRSEHPGGAVSLLADGRVQFLTENIDLTYLAGLCTRAGAESTHER
jgi:prepilin-type N-terminal cleavage/methylation domain-containing protein